MIAFQVSHDGPSNQRPNSCGSLMARETEIVGCALDVVEFAGPFDRAPLGFRAAAVICCYP
jgi:hypothetical protein